MVTVTWYDTNNLAIKFRYNPELVARVKQLPGRRYVKSINTWVVPYYPEIIDELGTYFPGIQLDIEKSIITSSNELKASRQAVIKAKENVNTLPDIPFNWHTVPMAHQKWLFNFLVTHSIQYFGIFAEQGTGKTKVVLDYIKYLKDQGEVSPQKPIVVICPATVIAAWASEARLHRPELKVCELYGPVEQRAYKLQHVQADVFVINYQVCWRQAIIDAIAKRGIIGIVCDECHALKSPRSAQSLGIRKMSRNMKYRIGVSGTPATNGVQDYFAILNFIDQRLVGNSYRTFESRYIIKGGWGGFQVVGYRNIEELKSKIAQVSYRVRKVDCLDLPDKIHEVEHLEMPGEQRKVYKALADELLAEIAGTSITAAIALTKLMKFREITSGFVMSDEHDMVVFDKNPKLDRLMEIIEDNKKDHKIVVWCNFNKEIELITKALTAAKIQHVVIDGSVPIAQRGEIVRTFQEEQCVRVFVGNTAAGGSGITLHAADMCVFYSDSYSSANRLQAEDRQHRKGQVNKVVYITLVMTGTIDVAIQRALRNKHDLQMELLDDAGTKHIKSILYGESNEPNIY